MDSLRVSNGIKRIEVNDDGEYIEFSVTSGKFLDGFFTTLEWLESKEVQDRIDRMDEESKLIASTDDNKGIKAIMELHTQICVEAMQKIDDIFGVNASKKIFCGTIPDIFAITDFFEKITPFIEKYAEERGKNISKKYSTRRKGAKS